MSCGISLQLIENIGAPSPTRTGDLRIRSPTLYPSELWALPFAFHLSDELVAQVSLLPPPLRVAEPIPLPKAGKGFMLYSKILPYSTLAVLNCVESDHAPYVVRKILAP